VGISPPVKRHPIELMNTRFVLKCPPFCVSGVPECSSKRSTQIGLSLIELMVAMAISLFVLFAVSNVFLNTKMNSRLQAGVSRANESAQTSMELLAREIRHTAHVGCPQLGDPTNGAHRAVRDGLDASGSSNTYIIAQDNAVRVLAAADVDAPAIATANSGVIDILHGANDGVHLTAKMLGRRGTIFVTGDPGINTATVTATNGFPAAIISTCAESAEVFEVEDVFANPWRVQPKGDLRVPYTKDSRVMPAARTQFFLAPYTRPSDERSTLAVYSRTMKRDGVNWNSEQPIAHDVLSMQVIYQIDSDGDYQADSQLPFGSAYEAKQVVGLTLKIVFATTENVKGTNGRRVERPYTAAINIRARVS
jgi:type II secretory pathway component PulJ